MEVNIAGYPGDKEPQGSMWQFKRVITAVDPTVLLYSNGGSPGHSGSPVFQQMDEQYRVVGIHTYQSGSGGSHYATRINDTFSKEITQVNNSNQ
jgi:V8-like Glu-specific endopeptidase